jgi:phage terminase large subunit-like protein
MELIKEYNAKVLYIETNQGGDVWKDVFAGVPAKYVSVRQTEKKELRAQAAHNVYQLKKVAHVRHFPELEEQLLAFPHVPHDDLVDALSSAVLYFNKKAGRVGARQYNYMEVNG